MHIDPVDKQASAVNSSPVRLVGQIELCFRLSPEGKDYKTVVYVTPDISEIIFGIKWLNSMDFSWRGRSGNIELDGQIVPLHPQSRSLPRLYAGDEDTCSADRCKVLRGSASAAAITSHAASRHAPDIGHCAGNLSAGLW